MARSQYVTTYRRAVVLSLAVLALAACSSSKPGSGSTGTAQTGGGSTAAPSAPTPSSGSPATGSESSSASHGAALTAAQAKAIAEAGHLTSADLPGYTAKTGTADQTDASDAVLAKCIGMHLPNFVFHDPGVELHKGDALEIDSSIDTVARASDVRSSVAAFLGPKAPGCFEQQFRALIKQQGATKPNLRVTHVPVRVRDADVSFGLRLTGTFVVQGTRARINAYQLGAGIGQTEVAVSEFDAGVTLTAGAPNEAALAALLQKSVNRVAAAYPH